MTIILQKLRKRRNICFRIYWTIIGYQRWLFRNVTQYSKASMAQWLRVGLQVHRLSPHWFESQSVEIFFYYWFNKNRCLFYHFSTSIRLIYLQDWYRNSRILFKFSRSSVTLNRGQYLTIVTYFRENQKSTTKFRTRRSADLV